MRFVIKEGRNLEEAIEEACKELKVGRDQLEVEVLSEGSKGFFGLVSSKKTIIRATVKMEKDKRLIEEAKRLLESLLKFMHIEAKVNGEKRNGTLYLHIETGDLKLVIGKNGETLFALQLILNKIFNKNVEKGVNIEIDSDNYKRRRKRRLKNLAIKLAEKVKKSAKPVSTEPLNPEERKIIYSALENYKDIRTFSKGDGILKKVVILPKD